ncbi:NAD(P)/FAD-dependent oxidoreductase [Devosia sp.]|uniref:NAD(P)/FAD-dependent oxidoreductase n=1 Tax=Devosia sp. TaxID=1871048 RepID=UPI001AC49211|nr:NAD(P)/FAD-dependent oxidoreductase [Devosia sp.]MBN9309946.1 NAD(P)/FAD-dependent oxidoreductase [Devosia sp.]
MQYDVVIVGGSFAGLAAALYLGRARRSVCVLDTRQPRNRFAAASHGFFAQDGSDPGMLLATMRQQISAYPTVTFIDEAAVEVSGQSGGFEVALSGGSTVPGARLLLAFGISDLLPDIPGIAERWGQSVLHCPYCHGYEVSGRRLGVLNLSPSSLQQALLVSDWGPTTFYANGANLDGLSVDQLLRRGIEIEADPVAALVGEPGALTAIRFADGRSHPMEALFISPRNRLNSDLAGQIGCDIQDGPLGKIITVDDLNRTTVQGVFAAGDITRVAQNISFACADGVMAAMACHRSLILEG